MPVIRVSDYINEVLEDIKKAEGHSSKDSVIRSLLKNGKKLPPTRGAKA